MSGLAALATDFWPLPQLSLPLVEVLTPAILGVLFMITVVLLAMQFVTATLRIRLVTAFMAIVIIPLAILSAIQGQFTLSVLTNELSSSMRLAAQQTSLGVEKFIQEREQRVNEAAGFPIFAEYLAQLRDGRVSSATLDRMKTTLRVLDTTEASSSVYLSSFALLDAEGNPVYDTLEDRLNQEFQPEIIRSLGFNISALMRELNKDSQLQDYFLRPMRDKVPYRSQLQIYTSTKSYLYFSAPILDADGQALGVLRARYDGDLLQDLLGQYDRLRGENSHAMLIDENNIRLADTFSPGNRYKSLAPLSEETLRVLKANYRLPALPASQLSTDFPSLASQAQAVLEVGSFTTRELSQSTSTHQYSEISAVKKVTGTSWKVVYLLANFSDEDLRRQQRATTTLLTVLIAGLVAFVALVAAHSPADPHRPPYLQRRPGRQRHRGKL
jgi:hypothetical protein